MRNFSSETLAALSAQTIRTERLFESRFSSLILRYWTGEYSLSWNGYTWLGNGKFLGNSSLRDTTDLIGSGFTVQLSGLSNELIQLALTEARQTNIGTLWIGFFNVETGEPIQILRKARGYLDAIRIKEGKDSSTIYINFESRLVKINSSREFRYSNELQQADYPGDKGFEYIEQLNGVRIFWGRADVGRLRV